MPCRHLAGGFQSNLVLAYSVQLQKYSTPTVVTTESSSQADDIGFVIERKGLLRGFNGDEDKLKLLSDVKVINVVHGIIEVDLQTDFDGESEMAKVIVSLWESWCCCEIDGGLVEVETVRKNLEVYEV